MPEAIGDFQVPGHGTPVGPQFRPAGPPAIAGPEEAEVVTFDDEPDEKPERKPDEKPERKPDEKPERKPDEKPADTAKPSRDSDKS